MSFWNWFKPKPPKPPVPTPPPPQVGLTMHVVVRGPQGFISGAVISGAMGRPAWSATGVPLSWYMLEFRAPVGFAYGNPVSLFIKAEPGYDELHLEVPFAPDLNVTVVPTHPPARRGVTRLVGDCWADDDGLYHPMGTTFMHAIGSWMRGAADQVRANARYFKLKGGDSMRILGQVDWHGEDFGPRMPGYALGEVIDCLYEEGLKTHLCVTGGGPDPVGAARLMLPILQARRDKLLVIEAVNEGNASVEDAIAIIDILAVVGVPCALGLGDQGLDVINKATAHSKANVGILHEERSLDVARNIRQAWDFRLLEGAPACAEPQGPASSVAEETTPFNLAAMRAARIICGAGYFVDHTGHGVFGRTYPYEANTPPSELHSSVRFANLHEFPNADPIFDALRNADRLLPQGIENWAKFNTNQPVTVPANNINKLYGCRDGGRFAEIAIGTTGTTTFRAEHPCQLQISNPATAQVLVERHFSAGETVAVSGLFAYVLVGTLG